MLVDAHPGGPGSEAGQLNRAYRATARCLCREIAGPETSGLATEALGLSAAKRLAATGLRGASAESLLNLEPQLGDAWAAYLALAPRTVIRDLLELFATQSPMEDAMTRALETWNNI